MSAEGSSVKDSSQQSSTSGPKVKGEGSLFHLLCGGGGVGLVNDTAPVRPKQIQLFDLMDPR